MTTTFALEDYLEEFDERYLESYNQIIGGPMTTESSDRSCTAEKLYLLLPLLENKQLHFNSGLRPQVMPFEVLADSPLIEAQPLSATSAEFLFASVVLAPLTLGLLLLELKDDEIDSTSHSHYNLGTSTFVGSSFDHNSSTNGAFNMDLHSSRSTLSLADSSLTNMGDSFPITVAASHSASHSLNSSPKVLTRQPFRRRATYTHPHARTKSAGNPFYKPVYVLQLEKPSPNKPLEFSHLKKRKVSDTSASTTLVDLLDLDSYFERLEYKSYDTAV